MAEAVAWVWLTEGTYDKEYVRARTEGFEEFRRHILGEEDGPRGRRNGREDICGVQAHVIKGLAREWASSRTMLAAVPAAANQAPAARLMVRNGRG